LTKINKNYIAIYSKLCIITSFINIYINNNIIYKIEQSERQQIENLKLAHKKELLSKDECIKKLQEKSSFEENKKIIDIQNEFEKKIKSKYRIKSMFKVLF
jgi:hypothetical protein